MNHKKRFIFSIPKDVYEVVRRVAFDRNISMSKYVNRALINMLNAELDISLKEEEE